MRFSTTVYIFGMRKLTDLALYYRPSTGICRVGQTRSCVWTTPAMKCLNQFASVYHTSSSLCSATYVRWKRGTVRIFGSGPCCCVAGRAAVDRNLLLAGHTAANRPPVMEKSQIRSLTQISNLAWNGFKSVSHSSNFKSPFLFQSQIFQNQVSH